MVTILRGVVDIFLNQNYNDKKINKITVLNGYWYISTAFGIVVYDVIHNETKYTYNKIENVLSATNINQHTIFDNKLFVAMVSGIYYASLTHPNLADGTAWTKFTGVNGIPNGKAAYIASNSNYLYYSINDTLFYVWDKTTNQNFNSINGKPNSKIKQLTEQNNKIVLIDNNIQEINDLTTTSSFGYDKATDAITYNSKVWISDSENGLVNYENGTISTLTPTNPPNNYCTKILVGDGEFYIAPRGNGGGFSPLYDYNGTYYYNLKDRTWKILKKNSGIPIDAPGRDFLSGYFDIESKTCYLGSLGEGVSYFQNGEYMGKYDGTNSDIHGIFTDPITNLYIDFRVSAISKKDGALWVTTVIADRPLSKLLDGNWFTYTLSALASNQPTELIVDNNGTVWMPLRGSGIGVFNDNGTANTTDDKIRNLHVGTGKGNLNAENINCITKDNDGNVWIGTPGGVQVFYNPSSVFDIDINADASCPILNGYCLLKDESIKTICVDGANRKWIGTNNGVYLVNAEGNEILLNFTINNSPLISNAIIDIKIEPKTGEVFIVTDAGVISYMGEATIGYENNENIFVFPNPIKPEYNEGITIRGTQESSSVKITTVSGLLVKELVSLGGQAVWDGKTIEGQRVTPGIYFAILLNKEGKNAGITKIAVLGK